MLGFEIGQRESGFYSELIESQTDRITQPTTSLLVYRFPFVLQATKNPTVKRKLLNLSHYISFQMKQKLIHRCV